MCNSCKSCPINITTEEGEYADNTGCLASFVDAMCWYLDTGKVWACHSNTKRPCAGFLMRAEAYLGEPIKITPDTFLITERTTIKEIYTNKQGRHIVGNHCGRCLKDVYEDKNDYYMVNDNLWKGFGNGNGKLCWDCLEERMGRPITAQDLTTCLLNTTFNPKAQKLLLDAGRIRKRGPIFVNT